jgi:hypothetical protein
MEAYALSAKATKLAGVQDEKRPEASLPAEMVKSPLSYRN